MKSKKNTSCIFLWIPAHVETEPEQNEVSEYRAKRTLKQDETGMDI